MVLRMILDTIAGIGVFLPVLFAVTFGGGYPPSPSVVATMRVLVGVAILCAAYMYFAGYRAFAITVLILYGVAVFGIFLSS